MSTDEPRDRFEEYERLLAERKNVCFELRLYVSGLTVRSMRAIDNIKNLCETELKGRCTLQVIDLTQHPELAREEQVIAAPTLIKLLPLPLRRVIGDLADKDRVRVALNLTGE